jgi:hypothetical protein
METYDHLRLLTVTYWPQPKLIALQKTDMSTWK